MGFYSNDHYFVLNIQKFIIFPLFFSLLHMLIIFLNTSYLPYSHNHISPYNTLGEDYGILKGTI